MTPQSIGHSLFWDGNSTTTSLWSLLVKHTKSWPAWLQCIALWLESTELELIQSDTSLKISTHHCYIFFSCDHLEEFDLIQYYKKVGTVYTATWGPSYLALKYNPNKIGSIMLMGLFCFADKMAQQLFSVIISVIYVSVWWRAQIPQFDNCGQLSMQELSHEHYNNITKMAWYQQPVMAT